MRRNFFCDNMPLIKLEKPTLFLDNNVLHVSRRPKCTAWLMLGLWTLIFGGIFTYLTSNVYLLSFFLLNEIMFYLDRFGEWEDLVLYQHENKAVFERSFWIDKLCSSRPSEFFTMKLTDIRHIGVSIADMCIFILHRNGKITLTMKGLTREELQGFKGEINHFLNMCRLKYIDRSPIDPSERLLLASDSEEYLRNLPRGSLPISNELTVSDNVLGGKKTCYQVQQNVSFPNLTHGAPLHDKYQSPNLRRGLYTKNSTRLDYVKYRKVCPVPTS